MALGMCLGALGSQTGGSIIRPASFCGVAGIKPQYGLLSAEGIRPLAPALDHPGAIARTIPDLQLILHDLVTLENETWDSNGDTRWMSQEAVERLIAAIGQPRDRVPKLLRPRGFFDRRAEPVMLDAFERTVYQLKEVGAEIVERDDPFDFEAMLTDHRLLMAAEAAAVHECFFTGRFPELETSHDDEFDWSFTSRDEYDPHIRSLIEEGFQIPLTRYIRLRLKLDGFRKHSGKEFEGIDAVIAPATIGPAPDASTTGNPCFNSPFSYLGWPVASFPIGLSPEGLPLAIQFAGIGNSSPLLQTAAWSEAVIRRASRLGSKHP
jgi:aspartyl-tRNA(Asn)/glutamyl-tRNA(Gln) amidotransferase subunit A